MQRLNGLIDGNAPPFIILVLIMGALYNAQQALKGAEETPRGVTFKFSVRWMVYISVVFFLVLACLIIIRIIKNGIAPESDFTELDFVILIGILLSYASLTINALLLSRLKRKYTPEVIHHLPSESADRTDQISS